MFLILVLLGLLVGPSQPDIATAYTVERTVVSEDALRVHDLIRVENSLIALASTADRRAGTVLRSEDEGRTWLEFQTPLADAIDGSPTIGAGYPRTGLVAAGPWLVAFRSDLFDQQSPFYRQAVAVSRDLGTTWRLLDLPRPEGSGAIVRTAVAVDGRLILGGETQTLAAVPTDSNAAFEVRGQAYDAAFWVGDEIAGFQRLGATQFVGVPNAQMIWDLVAFDDRLVAVGGVDNTDAQCCFLEMFTVAWESRDGGSSWVAMPGLPLPGSRNGSDLRPLLIDGQLIVRMDNAQAMLTQGSSTWQKRPLPESYWSHAEEVALADGSSALTWSEDVACDCSVAFGGRLDDGQSTRAELEFDDCEDDSVRGDTRVVAPVLVGDAVLALATCGDDVWLASSLDGGISWDMQPLPGYDGDRTAVAIAGFAVLPDGDSIVVLLAEGPDDSLSPVPEPISSLRIVPID